MIRTLLAAGTLALGVATFSGQAEATTLAELSVDQMTDASELVVRGTVTEIWTEKESDGSIWTRVQFDVDQVLKGSADDTVVVSSLGGAYGGQVALVHGAPRFSIGEESLLFLETSSHGANLSIVGMWQGKYTVRIDPDSGKEIGVRFVLSQDSWYDHRFLPFPAPEKRVQVDALETQILDRLETGWDGQPIPGASLERLGKINATRSTTPATETNR